MRPTPGRRTDKTEPRGKWTFSFWFISTNNSSSSTSWNVVWERHAARVRQWHWHRRTCFTLCYYSALASLLPGDTDGVSLSRVSQSLDFSAENLTAWKRQSETETVQDCTNESEKRAVQCVYDLETIKYYVGSCNSSFKTVLLDRSDNESKLICETDYFDLLVTAVPTRNTHVPTGWSSRKNVTRCRKSWSTWGNCRRGSQWTWGGMLTIYRKCWRKCWCWEMWHGFISVDQTTGWTLAVLESCLWSVRCGIDRPAIGFVD